MRGIVCTGRFPFGTFHHWLPLFERKNLLTVFLTLRMYQISGCGLPVPTLGQNVEWQRISQPYILLTYVTASESVSVT